MIGKLDPASLLPASGTARRAWLSRTKTVLYREPLKELRRLKVWGPRAYFRCNAWAREMERAAATLPPIKGCATTYPLYFLTGARFWYQTMFCAWTFAKHAEATVTLHLIDDGTLRPDHVEHFRRVFPFVHVLSFAESKNRLERLFPADSFPTLRKLWSEYIHIRKLMDVHAGSAGCKLVFDSDMLFFGKPTILLEWLSGRGETLLHMQDCVESYGYPRAVLGRFTNGLLPECLNVGICGLRSEWVDWPDLERVTTLLVREHGMSYYLEQALVALLATHHPCTVAASSDYITFPDRHQVKCGEGVLHHYVSDSKPSYFAAAWRTAIARANKC